MRETYTATAFAPDGSIMQRLFKGKPVGPVVLERQDARRAWLSVRGVPDKPSDWPPGVVVKVVATRRQVWAGVEPKEELVYERRWDGKQWIEVSTGEAVE